MKPPSRMPCNPLWKRWALRIKERCNYCHVEDRASDEEMQKVIARKMITMVYEINVRFPNGEENVTRYTCHRGSTTPATQPGTLA